MSGYYADEIICMVEAMRFRCAAVYGGAFIMQGTKGVNEKSFKAGFAAQWYGESSVSEYFAAFRRLFGSDFSKQAKQSTTISLLGPENLQTASALNLWSD